MRLLLDTHVLAWLANDRRDLTSTEQAAIEHADDLIVSVISLWELRLKWRSNPRRAADEKLIRPEMGLAFAAAHGIEVAAFTPDIAVTSLAPPLMHKDPFDEVLLVHAQLLSARLLTRDTDLTGHPHAYYP